MDSFEKFDETELPSKDKFFSSLKGENINEGDYERAKNVWNTFCIRDLGEYYDRYLKIGVLLSCDVFEKFISTCLNYYGLDPCHYFSSPGLAWDAMLKMTGVELELIDDIDMYLFIEKGMRVGISYITKRYSKANNNYMKNFDRDKETVYNMYFDTSNLYGWAMTQCLPYGGFSWMTEEEIDYFDISSVEENCEDGYILEVDIEYPCELHGLHNDYPLAPEKVMVDSDMLSKYCSDIASRYDIKVGQVNRLIPNLADKEGYVIHYRNLQLYLSLGMKLINVHRILKFKQSDWLKKFVDFNTEKRKNAGNRFEESFFKLMVNSVFGKTMENLRNRIDAKLVNNVRDYVKSVSRSTFVSQKLFSKNFVAIHKIKPVLLLNKPIYVGFSILELSKLLIYDFHYNYFKKKYDATLLFTDTDSLTYEINGVDDIYEKIYKDKDFSNYLGESRFYDSSNKRVIGKMKYELGGKIVSEFIGLKSKMYSLVTVDDEEKIGAKGVNAGLRHSEFFDILFDKKIIRHNMKRIQSKLHRLGAYDVRKVSLSCFDDKRYILDDGINTLAYFHKDICSD